MMVNERYRRREDPALETRIFKSLIDDIEEERARSGAQALWGR